jgi:hypothetical protein
VAQRLSPAAYELLREAFPSVLHLDVLLLLDADRLRWWSCEAVASSLRAAPGSVSLVLEQLGTRNLLDVKLASAVLYKLAPWDEDVGAAIAEIAALHYADRDALVTLLRSPRPASDVARRFADAFRLRRPRIDG